MALKNAFGALALDSSLTSFRSIFAQDFSRILERRFKDTEEVRYDIPTDALLADGSIYLGVADDGTATSAEEWTIVRIYFDSQKLPTRSRIRKLVAWDDRATGWT